MGDRGRERRWVVVAQAPDGRYVTLGRDTDPDEAEIGDIKAALQSQGIGGFLAIMEGNPWIGPLPHLIEVRTLGYPSSTFAEAAAACIARIRLERETAAEADSPTDGS